MSYTYAQFQTALALEMAIPNANVADVNFQAILPTIVDYAEQRCYRDLDLIYATNRQTTTLVANLRTLDLTGLNPYLYIVEDMNVVTPASVVTPDIGTRNQLWPVSKEFLDMVYGSVAQPKGVPKYFAMMDDATAIMGPWPDQAYTIEIVGKFRPIQLYNVAAVNGTFLSVFLPDLFLAAAMISASAYRHNFGAQADDPRMAVSWETQYQTLLETAKKEEQRKKFHSYQQIPPAQTPPPPPSAPM